MRRHSLSVRLLGFAALTTLIVLFTTSLIFNQLFEDYFQRRLQSELATQLQQLTANLSVSSSGEIVVKEMSDIRFSQPLSGYYWQIQRSTGAPIISRSLWDQPIEVAAPMEQGVAEARTVYPPGAEPLLALTWSISVNGTATPEVLVMTVASNLSEIKVFAAGFRRNITVWLAMLGVALMMAAWAQVRLGLRPLDAIRSEIRKIRDAPGRTLEGNFPTEVTPLVNEVNELLQAQQKSIEQARHRSSDLAHGLKTPLTVMRALAMDIKAAGQPEIANQVEEQIGSMGDFISRELARSRSGDRLRVWIELAPIVERMIRAMARMPNAAGLRWETEVPANLYTPLDAHDMSEMLGNLLDNAQKNAKSLIRVVAGPDTPDRDRICIIDDGPGIPENDIASVLERGTKLGSDTGGQGLGLTICQDLAVAYGCKLTLSNVKPEGFQVCLSWPAKGN